MIVMLIRYTLQVLSTLAASAGAREIGDAELVTWANDKVCFLSVAA